MDSLRPSNQQKIDAALRVIEHQERPSTLGSELGVHANTVRYWVKRFLDAGRQALTTIEDRDVPRRRQRTPYVRPHRRPWIERLVEEYIVDEFQRRGLEFKGKSVADNVKVQIVEFVQEKSRRTRFEIRRILNLLDLSASTYYEWCKLQNAMGSEE